MIRTQGRTLTALRVGEEVQVALPAMRSDRAGHRKCTVGETVILKLQVTDRYIGFRSRTIDCIFLSREWPGVGSHIFTEVFNRRRASMTEYRRLIGIASDQNWNGDRLTRRESLRWLFRYYPAVNNGAQLDISVTAPDIQQFS